MNSQHFESTVNAQIVGDERWKNVCAAEAVLQGVEASMWAIAYCLLEGLPDQKSAMLYSLGP